MKLGLGNSCIRLRILSLHPITFLQDLIINELKMERDKYAAIVDKSE